MKLLKNFINIHERPIKISVVVLITIIIAAVVIYVKFYYEPGHGIDCFTYKHLGIYCMGCGSTRQLYYALSGDLSKAFSYNVAGVIIYPTFAYLYYFVIRWAASNKKIKSKEAFVIAGIALALVLYMIFRNIPIKVFDFLRPPG